MEKMISPEERMRRAEEIYYRRKQKSGNVRMSSSQVTEKVKKRQFSLYKKMVLQILICILIYLIFSLIKETNYLFSENVINKTKEFLSTDINFSVIAGQVGQFLEKNQGFLDNWLHSKDTGEDQENNDLTNSEEQSQEDGNSESESSSNSQATGIGGASTNEETVATSASSSIQKTQMEIDAEYIKTNFEMQLPVKGEITSNYGKREATEIVSANHQGIDIGVVVGTTIVATMEGEVSVVSDKGDYGIHVKIVNKDVTTIYAHCSEILVKEGTTVKKGQKIALSGNTGNTTGPHLHFEIRRSERTVDPAMVLNWEG